MKIMNLYFIICVVSMFHRSNAVSALSPCGSQLIIQCPTGLLSRKVTNKIRCTWMQGRCIQPPSEIQFILDVGNSSSRFTMSVINTISHVYEVKADTVGTGTHTLICQVQKGLTPTGSYYEISDICYFIIKPESPTAKIKGGVERIVEAGQSFLVDGSESINNNGDLKQLSYKFECTVKNGDESFCSMLKGRTSKVTVPPNFVVDGAIFNFTLTVTVEEVLMDSKQQIIIVKKDALEINIVCQKNCEPLVKKTDVRERTLFEIECFIGTERVKKITSKWVLMKEGVKVESEIALKSERPNLFSIESKFLVAGVNYSLGVNVTDAHMRQGISKIYFVPGEPPKIGHCLVEPPTGIAGETDFAVKCDKEIPGDLTYKIYSSVGKKVVLLTTGPLLDNISFKLPKDAMVRLEVVTDDEFQSEKLLDVKVTMPPPKPEEIEAEQKELFEQIEESIKKENYDEVLQLLNANSEKIAHDTKNFPELAALKEQVHSNILETLHRIPIETSDHIKQISQLAVSIVSHYDKANPDITSETTKICKDASEKYYHFLEKEKAKGLSSADETLGYLSDCFSAPLAENEELIENINNSTVLPLNVTSTAHPILELFESQHYYEEYADNENISTTLYKYHESVENIEDICYNNGRTIAQFTMDGEGIVHRKQTDMNITIYKDTHVFFLNKTIEAGVLILQNSEEHREIENKSNYVVVCSTIKNAFWWVPHDFLRTALAFVQYDGIPTTTLTKPFLVTFEVYNHTVDGADLTDEESIYNGMSTYRVNVIASYNVLFYNVTDEYTVLVTDFIKPTLEELKEKGAKINANKTSLYQGYNKDYGSWHYVNIMKEDKKSTPSFKVITLGCYKWNKDKLEWEFACTATKNSTDKLISCLCYSTSILRGQINSNEVSLERIIIFNFELECEPVFVVAVILCILLFLFCACLVFFNRSNKRGLLDQNILFLSDVPRYSRYAYLVIVHTDKGRKDGTTSNVSIKLVGEQSSSREHVLNYPDPQRQLLQKGNEDWFVLGTTNYLGPIKRIEIWFDSIGIFPNWYCKSIEVYDLQTQHQWYFPVQKLFSLDNMTDPMHVVEPYKEVQISKKKWKCNPENVLNKPHFWLIDRHKMEGLTKHFRLVVIYSIILTILLMCLVMFGFPEIRPRDSLRNNNFALWAILLICLGSCCFAFLIHGPLVWVFRKLNISENTKIKKLRNSVKILCWAILIINILVCNTLLLLFGLWINVITSFMLVMTTIGGVIIYIFFFEYLMMLTYNPTYNFRKKIAAIYNVRNVIMEFVERQRIHIYNNFGHSGLRPYLAHLYKPLEEFQLIQRQELSKDKMSAVALLEDLIMYLIYLLLLYLVLLSNRDSSYIYNNLQLSEIMDSLEEEDTFTLWQINSFVKFSIIDTLQSNTWYPHYTAINPGLMMDKHNSYFGVARLRQLRTKRQNCSLNVKLFFPNCSVLSDYNIMPDTRNFSMRWRIQRHVNKYDRLFEAWNFHTQQISGAYSYDGIITSYEGGGYVGLLGRTYKNSHINMDYYLRNNWLDTSTRILFVEFLSYNIHSNLFNNVDIIFELTATGATYETVQVATARLLDRDEDLSIMILVVMVAFVIILSMLIIKVTIGFIQRRKLIFKKFHFWLFTDLCVIIISVTCIILHSIKTDMVKEFLTELETKKLNEFVPYVYLFFAEWIFSTFAGILICIATIRLWKLLRFILVFQIMERTLVLSMLPILNLLICHCVFLIAFAIPGYLIFGENASDFCTLSKTMITLILCSIGQHYEFDFTIFTTWYHYFYYCAFMFISLIIYTLYIATIIFHYKIAQTEFSNKHQYSVQQYLKERFSFLLEFIRVRVFKKRARGGEDPIIEDYRVVSPKADEHRYANCMAISSHRLQIMNLITQATLRKDKYSKKQIECLNHLIWSLHSEPEIDKKEMFFLDKLDPKNVKIVDDHKLIKMQYIASLLLDAKKVSQMEREKKESELYEKVIDKHLTQITKLENYLVKVEELLERINI